MRDIRSLGPLHPRLTIAGGGRRRVQPGRCMIDQGLRLIRPRCDFAGAGASSEAPAEALPAKKPGDAPAGGLVSQRTLAFFREVRVRKHPRKGSYRWLRFSALEEAGSRNNVRKLMKRNWWRTGSEVEFDVVARRLKHVRWPRVAGKN